jgi:hypothetical protein
MKRGIVKTFGFELEGPTMASAIEDDGLPH